MRKLVKKFGRRIINSQIEKDVIKKKNQFINQIRKRINFQEETETLLFSHKKSISKILYYNEIYKNILKKPGVIMEFGVEFGSTLNLLSNLRSIYEPYNYSRKIIGFDTFSGFTSKLSPEEKKIGWKKGDYSVPKNYKNDLEKILSFNEQVSVLNHIKKFDLVEGDASKTLPKYLKKNQQTIISLAIFDMDVYKPTKIILNKIKKRLFKGSVLVFDELNHPEFPGETLALLDSIGLKNIKLKSFHGHTFGAYCVLDKIL